MLTSIQTLVLFANESADLELVLGGISVRTALIGSAIIIFLTILGAIIKDRIPKLKAPIFILIAITTVVTSFILIALTIYINVKSSSKGPVHWHADYEIWACDKRLNLRDPAGFLTNKIGTATYHEHNDDRIHLEGVVVEPRDASLGKFFKVVGGELTDKSMVVPLNDNVNETFINGDKCPDGQIGEVQVFVYKTTGETVGGRKVYKQEKLQDPANYIISGESQVPPGDCVIFEFGPQKNRTEHMCLQYQVQDKELGNYVEVMN